MPPTGPWDEAPPPTPCPVAVAAAAAAAAASEAKLIQLMSVREKGTLTANTTINLSHSFPFPASRN
jgi:hypothetical protein